MQQDLQYLAVDAQGAVHGVADETRRDQRALKDVCLVLSVFLRLDMLGPQADDDLGSHLDVLRRLACERAERRLHAHLMLAGGGADDRALQQVRLANKIGDEGIP